MFVLRGTKQRQDGFQFQSWRFLYLFFQQFTRKRGKTQFWLSRDRAVPADAVTDTWHITHNTYNVTHIIYITHLIYTHITHITHHITHHTTHDRAGRSVPYCLICPRPLRTSPLQIMCGDDTWHVPRAASDHPHPRTEQFTLPSSQNLAWFCRFGWSGNVGCMSGLHEYSSEYHVKFDFQFLQLDQPAPCLPRTLGTVPLLLERLLRLAQLGPGPGCSRLQAALLMTIKTS